MKIQLCSRSIVDYLTLSELRNIIIESRENYKLFQYYLVTQRKWYNSTNDDVYDLEITEDQEIPKSVRILKICETVTKVILPMYLKELTLEKYRDNLIDLPPNLESLKIWTSNNITWKKPFPERLKHLSIGIPISVDLP